MKKKLFISIFTLFMLSGCSVNYDLTITEDNLSENIRFTVDYTDETQDAVDRIEKTKQFVYPTDESKNTQFYTSTIDYSDNNIYIDYNYNHTSSEDYSISNAISQCYSTNEISNNDTNLIINTSNEFQCLFRDGYQIIDSVQINITTDLKVTKNNADEVKGNTYTWEINKNNYQEKPINLEITKKSVLLEEIKTAPNRSLVLITAVVAILIIIIVFIIKQIQKNKNKI